MAAGVSEGGKDEIEANIKKLIAAWAVTGWALGGALMLGQMVDRSVGWTRHRARRNNL